MRAKRKRKGRLVRALTVLMGMLCAITLGFALYATMIYQLSDVELTETEQQEHAQLALSLGKPAGETLENIAMGGKICRVLTRQYALQDGKTALAVSASPAAYAERLAQEGWTPQLVTGFTLAGLDAVCETREGRALLLAREGDAVFLLETDADEQTLYTLGAQAYLSTEGET